VKIASAVEREGKCSLAVIGRRRRNRSVIDESSFEISTLLGFSASSNADLWSYGNHVASVNDSACMIYKSPFKHVVAPGFVGF
jgi:hypothetical protein